MLGSIFQRFVEKSPISVMARGLLERALNSEKLDAWFERTAINQYVRDLLFSSVFELMHQVVFTIRPSIHAAYQQAQEEIGVSVQSVYNKLNGIELGTSAELVRYTAGELAPIIEQLGGQGEPWVPEMRIKILDGNCIEATEHRLKELRDTAAGALPGKSLVVFEPALGLVTDVFPCPDGHAQERSLLDQVLPTVSAQDLWIGDRNFCTRDFLFGIDDHDAYFIIRHHQGLPFEPLGAMRSVGAIETGHVSEQPIQIINETGDTLKLRRIRVALDQPTREGETEIFILTNVPRELASAENIAHLYRRRWTIETAFQQLERDFHSEINTLGYPKAALFGFCTALVAYNIMAVVRAALKYVHGAEKIDQEVSEYYLADELAGTYRGMMIAIPAPEWVVFRELTTAEVVDVLIQLAQNVRLSAFKKHPRGPKKPRPKRRWDPHQPHVSTAKLIAGRRAQI